VVWWCWLATRIRHDAGCGDERRRSQRGAESAGVDVRTGRLHCAVFARRRAQPPRPRQGTCTPLPYPIHWGSISLYTAVCDGRGWLGNRVVSALESGAEGTGFKSQPRRCRVTVLGKLLTPIVPLFTKQKIGSSPLKGCGGNCWPGGK